jgi:hypothetical protein
MTCDRYPHQFVTAGLAISLERILNFWISQGAGTGRKDSSAAQYPGLHNQSIGPVRTAALVAPR